MAQKRAFKTKKVLAGFRTEYRAWKEWDEEDRMVFKFLGTTPNKMSPSKRDYLVEVLDVEFADKKEEKRLKPGTRVTLNSAGQLDKGMADVDEGAEIQVVYKGSNEMEGGKYAGGMAHSMEVEEVEEDDGAEDPEAGDDEDADDL